MRQIKSMRKDDVICPKCKAGFWRMELSTRRGIKDEYRCPLCDQLLETFDGSTEIAYRLTIVPLKARTEKRAALQ